MRSVQGNCKPLLDLDHLLESSRVIAEIEFVGAHATIDATVSNPARRSLGRRIAQQVGGVISHLNRDIGARQRCICGSVYPRVGWYRQVVRRYATHRQNHAGLPCDLRVRNGGTQRLRCFGSRLFGGRHLTILVMKSARARFRSPRACGPATARAPDEGFAANVLVVAGFRRRSSVGRGSPTPGTFWVQLARVRRPAGVNRGNCILPAFDGGRGACGAAASGSERVGETDFGAPRPPVGSRAALSFPPRVAAAARSRSGERRYRANIVVAFRSASC